MSALELFGLMAFLGVATIVAALWDYRLSKKRPSSEWQETTSTTMRAGKTRHIVITYREDDR